MPYPWQPNDIQNKLLHPAFNLQRDPRHNEIKRQNAEQGDSPLPLPRLFCPQLQNQTVVVASLRARLHCIRADLIDSGGGGRGCYSQSSETER